MLEVDQHRRTIKEVILEKENLQKEIQRCDQKHSENSEKRKT